MSVLLTALVWVASLTQKADAHMQVLQERIKCRWYFLADTITLSSTLRNGCCRFFFLPDPSLWLTLLLLSNCPQLCLLTKALTLLGVMMAGKAQGPLPFTWLREPFNLFPSGTPLRNLGPHFLSQSSPKSSTREKSISCCYDLKTEHLPVT